MNWRATVAAGLIFVALLVVVALFVALLLLVAVPFALRDGTVIGRHRLIRRR